MSEPAPTEAPTATETPQAAPSTPDWRSGLSDDYKGKYSEFSNPNDLMKSYDSLVKKMGQNPISRPKEGASDEDMAAFRKSLSAELGATENVADYGVNLAEDLPDFVKAGFTDEIMARYQQKAIESGMNPTQFQGIVNEYVAETLSSLDGMREATNAALAEKYGDETQELLKGTTEFAKQYFPEFLDDPYLGNNFNAVDALVRIYKNFGDKIGEGDVQGFTAQPSADSKAGLEAKREELMKKSLDETQCEFKEFENLTLQEFMDTAKKRLNKFKNG